ncbi:hypothetical protein F5B21DRAFT_476441 [Xylaria acuta]|nr:hypothetical protein F5B21DRAFT_476441 [Xylaria acuta]
MFPDKLYYPSQWFLCLLLSIYSTTSISTSLLDSLNRKDNNTNDQAEMALRTDTYRVSEKGISERASFDIGKESTGQWPRRLLHVPEMRSYERQNGNMYRQTKEPPYNILTYTWGRWQVDAERAKPLVVKGISWKVPSIDPEIFTAEQFHQVLAKASSNEGWIWVDIACIDQEDPAIKAEEIGRQAAIFLTAHSVFVWLHQSSTEYLQHLARVLSECADLEPEAVDSTWLERARWSLDILDRDPWFTSLWTLQESFLRPFAAIIAKGGEMLTRMGDDEPFGFSNLLVAWGQIQNIIDSMDRSSQVISSADTKLIQVIERKIMRLALYAPDNPVILYTAAAMRRTTFEEDRIYGIMQVFNLSLGKSRSPRSDFTLRDLELQFSCELNEKSPIWAQLFVHTSQPESGMHWCISQSCEVPQVVQFESLDPHSQCRISVNTSSRGEFEGLVCLFPDLMTKCWQMDGQVRQTRFYRYVGMDEVDSWPAYIIVLDSSAYVEEHIPAELRDVYQDETASNQSLLGQLLLDTLGSDLHVCYLGKLEEIWDDDDGDERSDAGVGLLVRLLRRGEHVVWQRLGIMLWDCQVEMPMEKSTEPVIPWKEMKKMLD